MNSTQGLSSNNNGVLSTSSTEENLQNNNMARDRTGMDNAHTLLDRGVQERTALKQVLGNVYRGAEFEDDGRDEIVDSGLIDAVHLADDDVCLLPSSYVDPSRRDIYEWLNETSSFDTFPTPRRGIDSDYSPPTPFLYNMAVRYKPLARKDSGGSVDWPRFHTRRTSPLGASEKTARQLDMNVSYEKLSDVEQPNLPGDISLHSPNRTFDSRTFTRPKRKKPLPSGDFNTCEDSMPDANSTFTKLPGTPPESNSNVDMNSTFTFTDDGSGDMPEAPLATSSQTRTVPRRSFLRKLSYTIEPRSSLGLNSTFTKENEAVEGLPATDTLVHDSSEDERMSSTSDGSFSQPLTNMGQVQSVARMQEESLKNTSVPSAPVSGYHSDNPDYVNEGVESFATQRSSTAGSMEGSSSIASVHSSPPESPYSSQSFEKQGVTVAKKLRPTDGIYQSMPNLAARYSAVSGMRGPTARVSSANGPVLNKHTSDPRLVNPSRPRRQLQPPRIHASTSTSSLPRAMRAEANGRLPVPLQAQSQHTVPHSGSVSYGRNEQTAPSRRGIPQRASALPQPSALGGIPRPRVSMLPAPRGRLGTSALAKKRGQ